MDWRHVELHELVEALREVDLRAPRPVSEFFQRFSPPTSSQKFSSRLKCNVYYYRTNYIIVAIASFMLCFIRNPLALASLVLTALGVLCLNDPFAVAFNDVLLRVLRRVHSRTALRLRAQQSQADGSLGLGQRRGRRSLHILMFPRGLAVAGLIVAGALLVYVSKAWLTLMWGWLLAVGLPLLHATFRSPNLKARLASAREEFRAVWRGYQADVMGRDYTM